MHEPTNEPANEPTARADDLSPPTASAVDPAAETAAFSSPSATLADGREQRLDPRSVALGRWVGLITTGAVALAAGVAAVVAGIATDAGATLRWLLFAAWVLVLVQLLAASFFWPKLRYRYTRWSLDRRGLRLRRGVVWRTSIAVPRSRIQHTDVSQGPLERVFGLSTVVVHTAGTDNASVSLPGLARRTALDLRDHLIEVGENDAV